MQQARNQGVFGVMMMLLGHPHTQASEGSCTVEWTIRQKPPALSKGNHRSSGWSMVSAVCFIYAAIFFFFFLLIYWRSCILNGFPCGSAGKESACNAGDLGSIPELGRSPGEGKGYLLQYSGLENPMYCIVHEVTKSWTWLSVHLCI